MPQIRALNLPVMLAAKAVVESTQLGGATIKVGLGEAPDCPAPYVILTRPTGGILTGTMANPEADADHRVQVIAVGELSEQSTRLLDAVRATMTVENLQTEFDVLDLAGEVGASRRVSMVFIDVSRGETREERGLPEPLFSDIDQYIVRTHPK